MTAEVRKLTIPRADRGLNLAFFFALVFVGVACSGSKVHAYTGSCQPTTTVVFKRIPGSFEMKAELLPDKSLYTIRPLSADDREKDGLLDMEVRINKYKDPHILIRPPLRTMLCEKTEIKRINDNPSYELPSMINCKKWDDELFELNIGSGRFAHSRMGSATDTEENIARVGKADAFMEFGTCRGVL